MGSKNGGHPRTALGHGREHGNCGEEREVNGRRTRTLHADGKLRAPRRSGGVMECWVFHHSITSSLRHSLRQFHKVGGLKAKLDPPKRQKYAVPVLVVVAQPG